MNTAELLHQIRSGDDAARESALTECMTAEELPSELLLAAIPSTNDPNAEVREAAVGVCERDQDWPTSIVPGLIEILEHQTGDAAYWSATLLGRFGSDAIPAIPALVEALDRKLSPAALQRVVATLGKIGPEAKVAKNAIERYATSEDAHLARTARDVIAGWGS